MTFTNYAALEHNSREDEKGVLSVGWEGDSGGPAILVNDSDYATNLIVGIYSTGISFNDIQVSCYTTFDSENVKWLKKIDKETKAIIPMDEIK